MTITLPNGNTLTVVPSDSSARYSQLTGDDWIELKWESPEYVEIPPGSSVEFQGVTYTVERPQDVNIVNRRNYEYTVRFDTVAARLKYIKYINPDDGRVEFSVTGNANVHLALLVRGANELSAETWTAGNIIYGDKEVTINYDGLYIYEAIELIAETFSTEFEIIGTAIHIRKVEYNKTFPIALAYGHGTRNGLLSGITRRNYGDRPRVVALAVNGGNRNLNTATNENAYDAKTLHMPVELDDGIPMVIGYDGQKFAYSDDWNQGEGYHYKKETGFDGTSARYYQIGNSGRILYYAGTDGASPTMPALSAGTCMDDADMSWIYPTVTHSITAVETRQETATSPDGTSETYTAYNVKIQTTIDYNDAIIPGSRLAIIFQTGQLAGKEFDANFILSNGLGTFVVVSKFIDDERMPGGTFVPSVGDKFRVFNCMLPQAYIREDSDNSGAEWEMAREAVKMMWSAGGTHYTWDADLSGIYAASLPQASFDKIRVGGYVSFRDQEVQPEDLLIRISEIKQPLNHPKWVEIKMEDFSRIRRMRRKQAVVSAFAQAERHRINDDISKLDDNLAFKPSVEQVRHIVEESSMRERSSHTNTSAYWSAHSAYIPQVGEIIVYSDGGSISKGGTTVYVPKIKIGDGVTAIVNLPFTDENHARDLVRDYAHVTGTAAVTTSPYWSARYDVTDTEVTEYTDGMKVAIVVPVAGNGSYGTALQINSLGYKPIVFATSSMISTRYPVGGIIIARYNAVQTAKIYLGSGHQNETVTGCWQVMDYNSDTTLIGNLRLEQGSTPVVAATYRNVLVCTNLDGEAVPLHSTPASASSQYSSTGTNKEMSRELFNPFGLIAYNGTSGIIAADGRISYDRMYIQYPFNPQYSFNCGNTLVAGPLYLVAEPAEDGQARLVGKRPCWSQELPTQYDGLIYILLGHHSGGTYSMLYPSHPVYWHNGDHVCVWSGDENQARDLAPVERGTLASQEYAEGDLMVTGLGLRRATEDIPSNGTLAGKTEITTVAVELNKKVKRNELLERTRRGIIVARAIPDHPRPGHRYFFTGNKIYVRTLEPYNEVLSDAGIKWRNLSKTDNEPYIYEIDSPFDSTIVEITANFNIYVFLHDSSYRSSMLRDASYLTTMETASPYFQIDKGRLVCVKRPYIKLKNGKLEVLDRIKIRRVPNANFSFEKKIKCRGNGAVFQKRLKWRPRWHHRNADPVDVARRFSKSRRWTPGTENRRGSSTFIVRGVARGRKSVECLKFHEEKLILDGDIYARTQLI